MTRRRSSGAIVAMLCVAAGVFQILRVPTSAQGSAPDLLFTNGKIITVDERFTIAQAVAVRGDRIVAVGTSQEIAQLAGPGTRTDRLARSHGDPGPHRQPHAPAARGQHLGTELRFDGVESRKQAIEMIRARAKAVGAGRMGLQHRRLGARQQFADDRKPFTREELDRIAPDNPVALQESYYQVFLNSRALKAFGIEAGTPDPPDFVKGSIMRDAAGKPTGIIKGDIAATRPVAARLPKVAPDQLEASSAGARAGHESRRPHVVRRRRLQRGRAGDLPEVEGAGPSERPRLLHRRRRRRHARSRSERSIAADRADEAVPGRQLHRQRVLRRERVHAAARPDVRAQVRSDARSARAVAPHGDGDRQGRPAAARARGAARHDRRVPRSDRGGQQGISDQEPALGARPRQSDQRVDSSSA